LHVGDPDELLLPAFADRAPLSDHALCSAAPALTAALPYNVASMTASVTLTGIDFAPADASVTALIAIADCSTSSWTTQTSVACIGIRGVGTTGTSGLSVAAVVGTSSVTFSFDGRFV